MHAVVGFFFFSSRRRHTRSKRDWSSDVCSSDLKDLLLAKRTALRRLVAKKLQDDWSPEQIAGWLAATYRSEERRVGKGCRPRGAAHDAKKNIRRSRGRRTHDVL